MKRYAGKSRTSRRTAGRAHEAITCQVRVSGRDKSAPSRRRTAAAGAVRPACPEVAPPSKYPINRIVHKITKQEFDEAFREAFDAALERRVQERILELLGINLTFLPKT